MKKIARTSSMRSSLKRFIMTMLFLGMAAFVISACAQNGNGQTDGEGKLKVTATTGMIADVAREVGGDLIDVTGLMGPGTDPHLYKASQGDIKRLDQADIVLYNGIHLEGTMAEMMEKLSAKKPTVAVAESIAEDRLITFDYNGTETFDPHVWFDVQLWIKVTETVRDTFIEHDAENAATYETQAAAYIAELEELDRYAKERIASIPEEGRVLVTAHDAFSYFGKAYGIKVMGLQGISTASEYGSKDVSALRDFLVDNKIKAVFIESSVPKRSIEAVIEGAKKLGHDVAIGGELFSDAMGEEGTPGSTYIGMVRHNVDTIANALQ